MSNLSPSLTNSAFIGARPTDENRDSTRYVEFKRRKFFGSLDGLRAISILAVIWHHAASASYADWVPLVHKGRYGVQLFFAISAFLISTLLLRAKQRCSLNVPRFWARRALRILPLYYAMLGAYVVIVFRFEHDPIARQGFFDHLRFFASFTSNWFVKLDSPRVIFYFAWSLAAEEQFYICWPWIERYVARYWPAVVAIGLLIMTQLANGLVFYHRIAGLGPTIMASVPAAILLGVVLAHVLDSRSGFAVVAWWAGRRGSAAAALLGVIVVLAIEPYLSVGAELIVAASLVWLVATCVIREDNDLARFLAWKPVAWVGVISYGIYLMHVLCLTVTRLALARLEIASPIAIFAATTVLSVAVASASFLTYERYFLRLKERWFAERAPSKPAEPLLAPVVAPIGGNMPTSK